MVFAAASSASTIAWICSGSQRAEFGHCDQQGEGGDVGDAGMLVWMAKRSARLAFASIIWRIAASTVAICRSICSDKGAYYNRLPLLSPGKAVRGPKRPAPEARKK
jgi:hypothetical protein